MLGFEAEVAYLTNLANAENPKIVRGKIWAEQDQFLIQTIKAVNEAWKRQQTTTNYCLGCVIPCVTRQCSNALESGGSFVYEDLERVKGIEPSFPSLPTHKCLFTRDRCDIEQQKTVDYCSESDRIVI